MQHRLYHLKTKINLILGLDKYILGRMKVAESKERFPSNNFNIFTINLLIFKGILAKTIQSIKVRNAILYLFVRLLCNQAFEKVFPYK